MLFSCDKSVCKDMRPEGKGSRTTLLVFSILVSLAQFDPSDGIPLCVSPFHGTQLSHPTGSSGGPKAAVRPNVCCLSPEGGRSAVVTVRAHRPPPNGNAAVGNAGREDGQQDLEGDRKGEGAGKVKEAAGKEPARTCASLLPLMSP